MMKRQKPDTIKEPDGEPQQAVQACYNGYNGYNGG